jgi:choline dehydrogenase-like flavoprotein
MDLKIQIQAGRIVRKLFQQSPLSTINTGETIPGFKDVPPGNDGNGGNTGSQSDWEIWVKKKFAPVSHPIATCAMMRKDLGGVVDGRLRVYGSQNVRVVDASIVPMQLSAHLSSTLYGVAEKAADMIKNKV